MSRINKILNLSRIPLSAQDYISRTLGYLAAAITLISGTAINYFPPFTLWIALFALIYPHVMQYFTRSYRSTKQYTARKVLIHIDSIICGVILAFLGFPIELTALFLIVVNTSFIVIGNLIAWFSCLIFICIGAAVGVQMFGYIEAAAVPTGLFICAALGVGTHLGVTAYNAHRQSNDLLYLKRKYKKEVAKFQQLSEKASKYISPQVWETIFTGRQNVVLETHRKKLVVFFSDIIDFTEHSEHMEPESLTYVLNSYLTAMSQIALKHGGTIDKFIGDSIMIFFGDPESKGTKRDAIDCLSMAINMRRQMQVLRKEWADQGIHAPFKIRMGINTGYCTVGNFGTESRMDYTIVGQAVNLASRLETYADPGEILISEEAYNVIKDKIICRQKMPITMKGISHPVNTFQVVDFRSNLGANPSFIECDSDGFSLYLDTYRIQKSDQDKVADALEKAAKKVREKML